MSLGHSKFLVAVASPLLAGLFGIAAGALVAWSDPVSQLSWIGLLALPLWLLLETFLAGTAEIFGSRSKWSRLTAGCAVLVGFYGAWISLRS